MIEIEKQENKPDTENDLADQNTLSEKQVILNNSKNFDYYNEYVSIIDGNWNFKEDNINLFLKRKSEESESSMFKINGKHILF